MSSITPTPSASPTNAIGPIPTPNPPANMSYTPQLSGGQIYSSNVQTTPYDYSHSYSNDNPGGTSGILPATNTTQKTTTQQPANNGGGFDWNAWKNVGYNDQAAALSIYNTNGHQNPGQSSGGSGGTDNVDANINAGYDAYDSMLNDIMNNSLPAQQATQMGVAQNNYNMGVGDLGTTQDQSLAQVNSQGQALQTNQAKNLNDLSSNLRNMFMAGNNYLGTRGAGDSSAANQYAYAISQIGNKSRADQMSQTAQLQGQLDQQANGIKAVYANGLKDLQGQYSNATAAVAQWYANAQDTLKTAVANGELSRGTALAQHSENVLTQAQNMLANVQQQAQTQYQSLVTWAENNSTNVNQLKSNLQNAVQQVGLQSPSNIAMSPTFSGNDLTVGANYVGANANTSNNTKNNGLFSS
jgi:hypothetical protein